MATRTILAQEQSSTLSADIASSMPFEYRLPPVNDQFVGREDVINTVRETLSPRVPPSAPWCVLLAAGGMGKTQVALKYAHQYKEDFDYIFWLSAQDEATLSNAYVDICRETSLNGASDALEQSRCIERTKRWLHTTSRYTRS